MILKRIVEFAEAHASGQPTGYQPRLITKVIQLRTDGTFRRMVPLSGERRGTREGLTRFEPQESPQRTVAVQPRLVSDNVNYVLGRAREKDRADKVTARHAAWTEQLRVAAQETGEPALQAINAWIVAGGAVALRQDPGISDEDDLTFEIDGIFPTELASVRSYWAAGSECRGRGTCLITGVTGDVVDRMPAAIKGVPEGQMSGTALISVNNAAGESYGLRAALNSPVSADAAEKLCNGLNMLLNERSGEHYRYSLRVGKAVYVAWSRKDAEFDFWSSLGRPDPEHVQQLIRNAFSGQPAPTVDAADFFVMALSANAARAVVRDYHETTLQAVQRNLGRWFRRLQIAGPDAEPARPVGVFRLAASLYRDARKEMPAHIPTALVSAAIAGHPLPEYLLGLAVKRNLAMQGPFDLTSSRTKVLSLPRLALIKAVLTSSPEDTSLIELDTNQPPAYHCGRMLAVLESIQRIAALPAKLNATLVDRNYGAACASPASIFGNLLKDATGAHLPKLRKNRPGAYIALDQRLQEVAIEIGPRFPTTLPLKDQGLFALGYYHQRARDFAEAKRNRELKELAETATTADSTMEDDEE